MALRLVVHHPRSASGDAGEILFDFDQARVMIGRSPGADVRLPGRTVSENHATIERDGDHYALRDEGSTNGTLVNGKALVPRRLRALSEGDEIQIAEFTLHFSAGSLHRGTTLPERTASLARRMLRELLGSEHAANEPPFLRATEGQRAGRNVALGEPPARLVLGGLSRDEPEGPAELLRDVDGTLARALDPKRGVDVNGKRVRERRLRHGDVVRAGSEVVIYQDFAEQALRDLEHQPDVTFRETRTLTMGSTPPAGKPPAASSRPPMPVESDRPEPSLSWPPPAEKAPPSRELPPPAQEEPDPNADSDSAPPASLVDLVIYGLAALVLLASLIGLVWLFR